MLNNYITIALRNLWRNKLYTMLNVSGLAIGISACLVIYLIVNFELSFDSFHPDKNRIFRVYTEFSGPFSGINPGVTGPLPFAIREEVTGTATVAAFQIFYTPTVRVENKLGTPQIFKDQSGTLLVEPQYFKVFRAYEWLAGSPETSLNEPFQVVLTESKAHTYFGKGDVRQVIGRILRYNDSLTVTVSGIVKNLPNTTDLYFTDFISFSTIKHSWLKKSVDLEDWGSTNSASQVFIKLLPGGQPTQIETQLQKISSKHQEGEESGGAHVSFRLQALSDIHTTPQIGIFDGSRAAVNPMVLRLLIVVALLLLLIAAINFINLVTAQAVKRSKEVGVRKVLGSTRKELVIQFLSETLLITSVAVFFSIMLSELALYYFQEFIPQGVSIHLSDPFTIAFLLLITLVVSVLSGLYPAFVLSSFTPVLALKNQAFAATTFTRTVFLRKTLIVFQFAFAQVLIVGTFIVGSQINFMLNRDMGFIKDAVVYFSTPYNPVRDQRAVLKQQLMRLPGITALSMHNAPPAANSVYSNLIEYNNGREILKHSVHQKYGDTAYIHLYGIQLVAGRNLQQSDTTREFLINETYARQLGFERPGQAVGKMVILDQKSYPIVGVVKDFHVQSLHNPVPPVTISSEEKSDRSRTFSMKLSTQGKGVQDFQATMHQVHKIWQQLYPEYDFNYFFLDNTIAKFYEAEQRTVKLARTATGIAILISCLGLFGLATYMAEQRTKEIGIRKVLGAGVGNITLLLSKDFIKLLLLAFLIASPIAWYAMHRWLEDFAYKVEIDPWIFITSGLLALVIAMLTVSYQSVKAALMNPVKSLRSE